MINIEFIDSGSSEISPFLKRSIARALRNCLEMEGITGHIEMSITFLEPETMREINLKYRDKDQATDVLSFPMFESKEEILSQDKTKPILIGDILINLEQASKQAEEYGNSFDREVVYLAVHSLLHLLGYDHEEETEQVQMRDREKQVIKTMIEKNEIE